MPTYSQSEINTQINQLISSTISQQANKAITINPAYEKLWREMGDLVMSGGKRIRPYLTYLAYNSFKGTDPQILMIAAAQEFLHFALLIHDDIIDRDTIRYGHKNIMGKYEAIYSNSTADAAHFASGAALMAGDLALSQAYILINQTSFASDKKSAVTTLLSTAIFEVAGGELLDMEAAFMQPDVDYFTIARYKTASYSFICPLLSGAVLASASDADLSKLKSYGVNIGIAYQMSDDLLGVYGDELEIGKSVLSDLREGKKTYLFDLIAQESQGDDKKFFNQVWGNPNINMNDIMRVRKIGVKTKSKERVETLMKDYAHRALAEISTLNISDENKQIFCQLANKAVNRNS